MTGAGLSASLRLGAERLELHVDAGSALRLPDDERVVAALTGTGPGRRRHRIALDGRALHWRRPAARVRAGLVTVAAVPVAPAVSVHDHLAVRRGAAVGAVLAEIPHLRGRGDDPAGVLSGGERRLLAWARAVLLDPRAVVLDRAATGLDAAALAWASERVASWRDRGVAVLLRVGRAEESAWLAARPTDLGR